MIYFIKAYVDYMFLDAFSVFSGVGRGRVGQGRFSYILVKKGVRVPSQ